MPWTGGWISEDHFTVDGTLIRSWASLKSLEPRDGDGRDIEDNDPGNPTVIVRKEKRSNVAHVSRTDPEARLMRKGHGKEAHLCYSGHVLVGNRHGLCLAAASILIPFPGTEIYETYRDEYELADWWLSSDRNYGAPEDDRHSYFESQLFPLGTVLDADFFRYSDSVKRQIEETFRFMYVHNLREARFVSRLVRWVLLVISGRLFLMSPALRLGRRT